jgi:hypothetical protein
MVKYFERIIDINTGEETVRNYTAAEIAEAEAAALEAQKRAAEYQLKEGSRASALAKLAALGLSADEIAAL